MMTLQYSQRLVAILGLIFAIGCSDTESDDSTVEVGGKADGVWDSGSDSTALPCDDGSSGALVTPTIYKGEITTKAQLESARGCTEIRGSIIITGGFDSSAPDLMEIRHIRFPNLERVHSEIWISSLSNLTSIEMPKLQTAGSLSIGDLNGLRHFDLPVLTTVREWIGVRHNNNLVFITLPKLAKVGDMIEIRNNPILENISLPSLTNVEQELLILDNDALMSCDLGVYTSTECPSLSDTPSDDSTAALMCDDGSSGASVTPTIYKGDVTTKAQLESARGCTEIQGIISLDGNFDSSAANLMEIRHVHFPNLEQVHGGEISIFLLSNVTSIEMPKLQTAGTLSIGYLNKLRHFDFPVLTTVRAWMSVRHNNSLVLIAFPKLAKVGDMIEIRENSILENISLPSLTEVDHEFLIWDNDALMSCDLGVYTSTQCP